MANKGSGKYKRRQLLATLVNENKAPCAFCQRNVDDEIIYGKLYAIGDIQCHYFCVLLSCCLIQKGKDEEGLFGFLYPDILAELERSKKHKCSHCGKEGATLGCSVSQCRKQFHLPCGREKNAVSLFFGNYKSFCQIHAPKQKIPDHIMASAKARIKRAKSMKNLKAPKNLSNIKELCSDVKENGNGCQEDTESVCVICYEAVDGFPTVQTFWPPCCARDAWFHRKCVQRMALSAGMHYLKCPLCNDKDMFYDAVLDQGYYVPDRDASWELEQNAFAEIYERPLACGALSCACPNGREHDADNGEWELKLCLLCGTLCAHLGCVPGALNSKGGSIDSEGGSPDVGSGALIVGRYVCAVCKPAAPAHLERLAATIDKAIQAEQAQTRVSRRGQVMPARMSLRRTKRAQTTTGPSTSRGATKTECITEVPNTTASRLDLNLKTPRKRDLQNSRTNLRAIENTFLSPSKLLEMSLHEKIKCMGVKEISVDSKVLERVREKFKKPRPLSEKKRIVDNILDNLFENLMKETPKTKDPIKEWSSPKKSCDTNEIAPEIAEADKKQENEAIVPQTHQNSSGNVTEDVNPTEDKSKGIDEVVDKDIKPENPEINDDSSNSTFQLPPEFIADCNSDDEIITLCDTPKKLKTVDIQKDSSLEISADDEIINIDVVKMEENTNSDFIKGLKLKSPVKPKKCAFKFSPLDKETLEASNLDIDMESFKNQYLNEVDRGFKCTFSHKHEDKPAKDVKLRTAIDFAVDAAIKKEKEPSKKKLKRKMVADGVAKKKKDKKCVLKYRKRNADIKLVCSKDSAENVSETINVTVDATERVKRSKKQRKRKVRDIHLKIRWKEERLNLKITKSQKVKKAKKSPKSLKQYVLKYSQPSAKQFIMKPEEDVTPPKRKYVKMEKSPDNLVQTSIQSFFKVKPAV